MAADSASLADAMVAMCAEIVVAFTPIMGRRGVAALYQRSLFVLGVSHPALAALHEGAHANLDFGPLRGAIAARTQADAFAESVSLLQSVQSLLASVIGWSLTESLLGPCWYDDSPLPDAIAAAQDGASVARTDREFELIPTPPSSIDDAVRIADQALAVRAEARATLGHAHDVALGSDAGGVAGKPARDVATDLRHVHLREANGQLVLAVLDAQALHTAAELAHRKQKEFLAVVAHELRNPLTPIRVAATLLNGARIDELPQLQETIERQVVHMTRLVGDLLDVSRANTGKLRLQRRDIDLSQVLGDAVNTCRPLMIDRKQRLDVFMPEKPLAMYGDPVRLAQVLTNLLDNASKYTPAGGDIGLTAIHVDDDILVTVSDNGIGVPADVLPNVFEPFVQDARAARFNADGLGIGLTVVRELVEAHGGRVVASSDGDGHGSTFAVTLPTGGVPASGPSVTSTPSAWKLPRRR